MLRQIQVDKFIEIMASKKPAPGGGSAAALCGAVGTALGCMVANLTVGKEKYQEHEELMKEILEESAVIANEFTELIDRDTEAFNRVAAVFALPKTSEEEKALRKEALQEALKFATKVPFSMMEKSVEALRLLEKSLGRSNSNAVSDLGVGALILKSSLQGAWLNVLINLGSIKDDSFVAEYKARGEAILLEAVPLADRIYNRVEESLL